MLQLLIIALSDFEADVMGDSVSHATHPHHGLAGLVPLLCPAALPSLLSVMRMPFRRVHTEYSIG